MAAFFHRGNINPLVNLRVVKLSLWGSKSYLLSRASDEDVSVKDSTARVAVTCILHALLVFEVEGELVRFKRLEELSALEHAVGKILEVSSSNHENSRLDASNLDHLEVVGEGTVEVYGLVLNGPWCYVNDRDVFRVLVEDKQFLWESHLNIRVLVCHELLRQSLSTRNISCLVIDCHDITLRSTFFCNFHCTFAGFKMLEHLLVHHTLTTARTIELEIRQEIL